MSQGLFVLTMTAASIALLHTLLGPDHYLPFIAMARARRWSPIKTTWITTLCGIGHVLSSVVIGTVGIAFGVVAAKLTAVVYPCFSRRNNMPFGNSNPILWIIRHLLSLNL